MLSVIMSVVLMFALLPFVTEGFRVYKSRS